MHAHDSTGYSIWCDIERPCTVRVAVRVAVALAALTVVLGIYLPITVKRSYESTRVVIS